MGRYCYGCVALDPMEPPDLLLYKSSERPPAPLWISSSPSYSRPCIFVVSKSRRCSVDVAFHTDQFSNCTFHFAFSPIKAVKYPSRSNFGSLGSDMTVSNVSMLFLRS